MELEEHKAFKNEMGEEIFQKHLPRIQKRADREFTEKGLKLHKNVYHRMGFDDDWRETAPTYRDLFGKRR
jgi:putative lipase involved disintegration of autophagic bodies